MYKCTLKFRKIQSTFSVSQKISKTDYFFKGTCLIRKLFPTCRKELVCILFRLGERPGGAKQRRRRRSRRCLRQLDREHPSGSGKVWLATDYALCAMHYACVCVCARVFVRAVPSCQTPRPAGSGVGEGSYQRERVPTTVPSGSLGAFRPNRSQTSTGTKRKKTAVVLRSR